LSKVKLVPTGSHTGRRKACSRKGGVDEVPEQKILQDSRGDGNKGIVADVRARFGILFFGNGVDREK